MATVAALYLFSFIFGNQSPEDPIFAFHSSSLLLLLIAAIQERKIEMKLSYSAVYRVSACSASRRWEATNSILPDMDLMSSNFIAHCAYQRIVEMI